MKFSRHFKLTSIVLLVCFVLEIFSPAIVLAASFSKKGKYKLNSYTSTPFPKQPAVKSQRSIVNKITEEKAEKPPRMAAYSNGKLLFAREYPELAKRPKTAEEWKRYKTDFYPPPVPSNRTYIPAIQGESPAVPFKNPPPSTVPGFSKIFSPENNEFQCKQ